MYKRQLITLAAFVAAVIAVFVVDQIIYNSTGEYKLLKQYQRNRLLVFLDPDIDPTGESYKMCIRDSLEADMRLLAEKLVADGAAEDVVRLEIEKLVRAYDPCLSCSVH